MHPLDLSAVRAQFPALEREHRGEPAVFFDGPAGSQVPAQVADAVRHYLLHTNANTHGPFETSKLSDEGLLEGHRAMADLIGVDDPELVAFGPNMTTLTLSLSRALASTWSSSDEILVSRLDHDANITPWVRAAKDAGATVRYIEFRKSDCTLDLLDLQAKLGARTKLVAVGAAANATGTINPIEQISKMVHDAGALLYVDAVHYAPHRLMDAKAWGADFVVCSAYKFFGPHVGALWGRRALLEVLPAYQVRPAADALPERWMTGTPSLEGIAGVRAAVDYLASLGQGETRRDQLKSAYQAIRTHEDRLTLALLDGLESIEGVRVLGVTDRARLAERVPTVAIVHDRHKSQTIAEKLAERGIFVWHGHFYALAMSEALGLEPDGMVRIGLLHYNTETEITRLIEGLRAL